jgi:hypothetical protein
VQIGPLVALERLLRKLPEAHLLLAEPCTHSLTSRSVSRDCGLVQAAVSSAMRAGSAVVAASYSTRASARVSVDIFSSRPCTLRSSPR